MSYLCQYQAASAAQWLGYGLEQWCPTSAPGWAKLLKNAPQGVSHSLPLLRGWICFYHLTVNTQGCN